MSVKYILSAVAMAEIIASVSLLILGIFGSK